MSSPTRANPSTDAYERARKVVLGWLQTLPPTAQISEDDGGQLIDSLAWEIDEAVENEATLYRNSLQAVTHSQFCLSGAIDRAKGDLDRISVYLTRARQE